MYSEYIENSYIVRQETNLFINPHGNMFKTASHPYCARYLKSVCFVTYLK